MPSLLRRARPGATALLAVAACGGRTAAPGTSGTAGDDAGTDAAAVSDASPAADATTDGLLATDAPHLFPDSGVPESPLQPLCTSPPDVDASLASLTTTSLGAYCQGPAGLLETAPCDGLVEVTTSGVDCASTWVFDTTTGALEYYSRVCDGAVQCSAVAGFSIPSACPTSAAWGQKTNLCEDLGADAAHASPPP